MNTLAGGGSFLSVPLLVLVGLPATVANATNRVGVLVQSLSAMEGFRREGVSGVDLGLRFLPAAALGSWAGAYLVARLPDAVFGRLFGAIMLLALPVILRNPQPREAGAAARRALWRPLENAIYFGLGVYGGAIQAGIGIPLLIGLVGASRLDLVRANGVKVVIVAAMTLVALAQFAWAGKVVWDYGIVLALGMGVGGYAASRLGARVGERLVRPLLVAVVVALALRLLWS